MDNMKKAASAAQCNWCAQVGVPSDCTHCPHGGAAMPLPADSLTALLMQSGIRLSYHYMDSNAEKESLSALTEDEQAKLKEILIKLLASWNKWNKTNVQ